MTDFDHDMPPGYGYSEAAPSNAPAWVLGIVIVTLLLGVFLTYSAHNSGTLPAPNPSAVYQTMPVGPPTAPAHPPEKQ
jgi:hypothetical protein